MLWDLRNFRQILAFSPADLIESYHQYVSDSDMANDPMMAQYRHHSRSLGLAISIRWTDPL